MNIPPTDFSISVVVAAHNEEQRIANVLQALLYQTLNPREVIVVDNHSSDNTKEIVQTFEKKFRKKGIRYRILSEHRVGAAFARNKAFYATKSHIIASTDADTRPHRDWIEKIRRHFLHNDSIAVSGIVVMTDAGFIVRLLSEHNWYKYLTFLLRLLFGFQTITTANAAVRSDMFKKVGGFNALPQLQDPLEDTELSSRLAKLGTIRIDTAIKVDSSFRRYQPLSKAITSSIRRLQSWVIIARR